MDLIVFILHLDLLQEGTGDLLEAWDILVVVLVSFYKGVYILQPSSISFNFARSFFTNLVKILRFPYFETVFHS